MLTIKIYTCERVIGLKSSLVRCLQIGVDLIILYVHSLYFVVIMQKALSYGVFFELSDFVVLLFSVAIKYAHVISMQMHKKLLNYIYT